MAFLQPIGEEGSDHSPSPWTAASGRNPPRRADTVSAGRLKTVDPDTRLVLISDPGQDLDDEMAYIMTRLLVEDGLVELRAVICTLVPAYDRARLCRGTLDLLGLRRVPVGIGSDGGDLAGVHNSAPFEKGAKTYMPGTNSEQAMTLEPGHKLLHDLYEMAAAKSLTILCIASLKDLALFLRDNEQLFVERTKEVVIMGGVDVPAGSTLHDGSYLVPDTAHNQEFDRAASNFLFRRCQELGVRLIVVSRWSAYAVKMPRNTYDQLAMSGSSVGRRLRNAQRDSIEQLWARACAPEGDARRKGLPARCDRKWFINTFCNGRDDPNRSGEDTIWDLLEGFMQYDTIALLCAVPALRSKYFEPTKVSTKTLRGAIVENLVVGISQNEPGLLEPKKDLLEFISAGFVKGLSLNHHFKIQVILLIEVAPSSMSDISLAIVMLRTLYELRTLHCLGIIATVARRNEAGPTAEESIKMVRTTMDNVGLRFVPLHHAADAAQGAGLLQDLYKEALPHGITIVSTAPLTAVAKFIKNNQRDFKSKTSQIVLGGGVLPRSSAEEVNGHFLEPDPEASNNCLDMEAATMVYRAAQEESLPLLVLSRFAATLGRVPKRLFDELECHGGPVGKQLVEVQRRCIRQLWVAACTPPGMERVASMGLPNRCDQDWFVNTFCGGLPIEEAAATDDIYQCITSFNVYSPMAILAAVPTALEHFMLATRVKVRAATHLVVGWSAADNVCVRHPEELQCALAHAFIYGSLCNASVFPTASDAKEPQDESNMPAFDMSLAKLANVFPSLHFPAQRIM